MMLASEHATELRSELLGLVLASNEHAECLMIKGYVKAKFPGIVEPTKTRAILPQCWPLKKCHARKEMEHLTIGTFLKQLSQK